MSVHCFLCICAVVFTVCLYMISESTPNAFRDRLLSDMMKKPNELWSKTNHNHNDEWCQLKERNHTCLDNMFFIMFNDASLLNK